MIRSAAPPQGIYVPAVLFFDENEELDEPSIRAHVLRLAKVFLTNHLYPDYSVDESRLREV